MSDNSSEEDRILGTYLHHLAETDEHGHEPGWYFSDETCDLHGPYKDRETAMSELRVYVQWLQRHA